jgi:outer membrane protein assembly factor BamE (lipoprotein component of BamABCDE complex)
MKLPDPKTSPKRFRPLPAALVAGLSLLALGACSPQVAKRGQVVDPQAASQLQAGLSTKTEVQKALGSPSMVGTFDKNVWYYLGQDVERVAFFAAEATDRKIVAVKFDDKGVVQQVAQLSLADGKQVELVARETPTAGNETTLMQDLFGNLGRFAAPKKGPASTNVPGR